MKNVGILKSPLMVVSLLEITTERGRSQKLYKLINVHSVTNAIDKITFFVVR